VETHDIPRLLATLLDRAGAEPNAERIAAAFVSVCQEVDGLLCPIFGQRGAAAMYKRSLYLSGKTHAWLADTEQSFDPPVEFAVLKSVLARQSYKAAHDGACTFLQNLYDLLASMVGPTLTEQLLRSLWSDASTGSSTQDKIR
jgi:hypothetical protein